MENDNVYWIFAVGVEPDKLDAFKQLMEEMVEATNANEPGALNYEWTVADDGRTVHLHERYVDSEATLLHLNNFSKNYAERFLSLAKPKGFTVYGNADQRVREALGRMGAQFYTPIGGFTR